jgi:DNA-binding response OmpR family regulator
MTRRPRRRVLFADDQPDVANTLAAALPQDQYDVAHASDGEQALAILTNGVFDLAVIDLRMPPGQWGGLWLLERLSERPGRQPALVLSGEAGQRETIQALRLGAVDFVVKDLAQAELAGRVDECCRAAAQERHRTVHDRLPRPVARAAAVLGTADGVDARARAALEAVEAALRFGGLAELARRRVAGELDSATMSRLASPSMGTWNDLCRRANRSAAASQSPWTAVVDAVAAEPLVTARNALAHGGQQSRAALDDADGQARRWLDRYFLAVERKAPPAVALAGALRYEPPAFQADVMLLMGPGQHSALTAVAHSAPLSTGRVYALGADGPADLWPFVLAEESSALGSYEVLLWDGFRPSTRGSVSDTDPARHTATGTGERRMGLVAMADVLQRESGE